MLSGLLALASRAFAEPVLDEESGIEHGSEQSRSPIAGEQSRSPIDVGASLSEDDLAGMSGLVDATSAREIEARRQPTSRWGRIDLSIAWRRTERIGADARRDEVWLVATWRR